MLRRVAVNSFVVTVTKTWIACVVVDQRKQFYF